MISLYMNLCIIIVHEEGGMETAEHHAGDEPINLGGILQRLQSGSNKK